MNRSYVVFDRLVYFNVRLLFLLLILGFKYFTSMDIIGKHQENPLIIVIMNLDNTMQFKKKINDRLIVKNIQELWN